LTYDFYELLNVNKLGAEAEAAGNLFHSETICTEKEYARTLIRAFGWNSFNE